jgi:hypothetical protein
MRFLVFIMLWLLSSVSFALAQPKTIHVYVALCDNVNQGIVPVPAKLGNGQNPQNNLYWGAMYGVKSYFQHRSADWQLIEAPKTDNAKILAAALFIHAKSNTYMLAQAYDGAHIETCIEDFLKASNGQNTSAVTYGEGSLNFGGGANLIAYVGHNGLMDFSVRVAYQPLDKGKKDVIILACYSKNYFKSDILRTKASPLLWTTHLMAPEAYTLEAAFAGWINGETSAQIKERAAQAYHKYQKCGIKAARRLFLSGH